MLRVVNLVLSIIVIALIYMLFQSLTKPIKVNKQLEAKNGAVYDALYEIRDAQEAYKDVNDRYTPSFDTLKNFLLTENYEMRNPVTGDVTRVSVLDSLFKGDSGKIKNMDMIPNSDGKRFIMDTNFLENPNDSTSLIPVFEAYAKTEDFLHDVNGDFWIEDKKVRMGSLTAPLTTGNWER